MIVSCILQFSEGFCIWCYKLPRELDNEFKQLGYVYNIDLTSKTITICCENTQWSEKDFASAMQEKLKKHHFNTTIVDDDKKLAKQTNSLQQNNPQDAPLQSVAEQNTLISFLKSPWFKGFIGVMAGIIILMVCMLQALPISVMIALGSASTLLTIMLGYEKTRAMLEAEELSMDTLFALSCLLAIGVSIAAFFIPGLPMLFEVPLLIFGFRHLGWAIENSIMSNMISSSHDKLLPITFINKKGVKSLKRLTDVEENDQLIINSGEEIPVDGICQTKCKIYDTEHTGSTHGKIFQPGDKLIAGMKLADNQKPLTMLVTAREDKSYLAKLEQQITNARQQKKSINSIIEVILFYFIPSVLGFALVSGIIVSLLFPPVFAIKCVISVLVSVCPCCLGLIVPLAEKIGVQKALDYGITFKKSYNTDILAAFEKAVEIDTVVFDLNGTLTQGKPEVVDFQPTQDETDSKQLLAYAAVLEKNSSHAVAKAICAYVKARGIEPENIDITVNQTNHAGIFGLVDHEVVDKQAIIIGNQDMMRNAGVTLPSENLKLAPGQSVVYIARDTLLSGYFVLSDPLRKNAKKTVDTLTKSGKKVFICSGADEVTAQHYANMLGVDKSNIFAGCAALAEDNANGSVKKGKVEYIAQLQQQGGKVAMIGDAGNDALAMAASDFAIAVNSSSMSARSEKNADVVISGEDLSRVLTVFTIAQQAVTHVKSNLILSLSCNTISILLAGGLLTAATGLCMNPGLCVALLTMQLILIAANAYYFQQQEVVIDHESQQDSIGSSYAAFNSLTLNSAKNILQQNNENKEQSQSDKINEMQQQQAQIVTTNDSPLPEYSPRSLSHKACLR